MKKLLSVAAAVALSSSAAVQAQSVGDTVSASDPDSIMAALKIVGHEPTLTKDDYGDPLIRLELAGMATRILFYDCNNQTNDQCESIQFSTGFDRKDEWNAAEAIQISSKYRFAAVSLDNENDPFISWDIVTGSGIPTSVFLQSVRRFENTISDTADIVFAAERGK